MIFSTLPLNTWSFSRNMYVCRELLTTTAIILPLMSLTVPCKTSSGIARQRLPPVQEGEGPELVALRIGLTKGSLRPFWPTGREGFFSFSAGGAASASLAGGFLETAAGGVLGTATAMTGALAVFAGTGAGLMATDFTGAGVFTAAGVLAPLLVAIAGVLEAPLAVAPVLLVAGRVPVATGSFFPVGLAFFAVFVEELVVLVALLVAFCAVLAEAAGVEVFAADDPLPATAVGEIFACGVDETFACGVGDFVVEGDAFAEAGVGDGLDLGCCPPAFGAIAIAAIAIASANT